MKLTNHYSGYFHAFKTPTGEIYARLLKGCSVIWFKFDLFTESYQSLDNEEFIGSSLEKELEEAFWDYTNNKFYEQGVK